MRRRRALALLALVLAAAGLPGCAARSGSSAGPGPSPREVYALLLARNAGLESVLAVAEARISYGGRDVRLPGVLLLDRLGGFRLELLDPLDRPLAVIYNEGQRVVQYRPLQRLAASLGVFTSDCGAIGAADWVGAVLASGGAPAAGEQLALRDSWFGDRSLERSRAGALRQSLRYSRQGEELRPRSASWYCNDEPALQLRVRRWLEAGSWRLPVDFEVEYPLAGLSAQIELREVEGNPQRGGAGLHPRPDDSTRWTTWKLPQ